MATCTLLWSVLVLQWSAPRVAHFSPLQWKAVAATFHNYGKLHYNATEFLGWIVKFIVNLTPSLRIHHISIGSESSAFALEAWWLSSWKALSIKNSENKFLLKNGENEQQDEQIALNQRLWGQFSAFWMAKKRKETLRHLPFSSLNGARI